MKETEFKILEFFKQNPRKEISTSEIVKNVFPEKFSEITEILNQKNIEKSKTNKSKQKKAQLHRKILYYLNKLVGEEILKLKREGSKGEKFFILSLAEGEKFIIDKYKKRIVIEKPIIPAMPVEGYEQKEMLFRLSPNTWVERLNAILIESSKYNDLDEFHQIIVDCFSNVNDAIALNDFETIVQTNTTSNIVSFLAKLDKECSDYGKTITCIIDFTNLEEKGKLRLIKLMEKCNEIKNINCVFDARAKELREHSDFFKKVIEIFSKNKARLYVKNQDVFSAPYIVGSYGPYTFDPAEWMVYKKELQDNSFGLACGQSCITVDVFRFLENYKTATEFRKMAMAVAKALLTANSMQRSKSSELFRTLGKIMPNFFLYSRGYIRFWNYGWKQPDIDSEDMHALIQSTKEEIQNFCSSQETIYLSCGMPTRFKIAFSCMFREFDEELSQPQFNKLRINKTTDFYSQEVKEFIVEKEKIFELFDGGDRIRFVRVGLVDPKEILREISALLTGYKLPFFCYDFGEARKDFKLSEFM